MRLLSVSQTHFRLSTPIYSCDPTRAKTDKINEVNIETSLSLTTDCISESTIVFSPGTIATVFNALKTLRVRRTDKLPSSLMKLVA